MGGGTNKSRVNDKKLDGLMDHVNLINVSVDEILRNCPTTRCLSIPRAFRPIEFDVLHGQVRMVHGGKNASIIVSEKNSPIPFGMQCSVVRARIRGILCVGG